MKKLIIASSIWILAALFLTGSFSPAPKYPPVSVAQFTEAPLEKNENSEVLETTTAPAEPAQPAPAPAPKAAVPAPKPVAKAAKPPVASPAPAPVDPAPQPSAPINVNCEVGSFNAQFLCHINAYRNSKGLNSLAYEGALNITAYKHSTWMNETKTMSHIGRDGSKYNERCIAENTTCDAENVAMGFTNAKKLLQAWIDSPSHNVNLLGRHTVMGLGLVGVYSTLVMR